MLVDHEALALGVDWLRPADFYVSAHRLVFETICWMKREGQGVDLLTVTAALQETGKIDEAGGVAFVVSFPNACPAPAMMPHYIEVLLRFSERRNRLKAGQLLQQSAMNGEEASSPWAKAHELLENVERRRASLEANGEVVSGETLIRRVAAFLGRFVVFASADQATAVSLWVLHTHTLEAAETTPYLAITSAEKESGKSRLLEVLEHLVPRPWRTFRPSEAVLFRTIAARCPTLLLDEVDAIFRDKIGTYEGHRALLNSGHRRGATESRCVGDGKNIRLEEFPVFCAKALAGIGELPDTVADRSIPIRLLRRKKGVEHIERFRFRDVQQEAAPIRAGLARWAQEHLPVLRLTHPEIPSSISDRAADGWEPLLAIADLIGGDWPRLAREAAVALHGNSMAQEETTGIALLRAIRDVFRESGLDRMTTVGLVSALVKRDDGPWAEWWGKAVSEGNTKGPGFRVARLLRAYAITSKTIRLDDGGMAKGYVLADFDDAFSRFLPSLPQKGRNNVTSLDNQGPAGQNNDVTGPPLLRPQNPRGALSSTACDVVTSLDASGEGVEGAESAEAVSDLSGTPTLPGPAGRCFACRGNRFWRGQGSRWLCAMCHPPATPELAFEWRDVGIQDGQQP